MKVDAEGNLQVDVLNTKPCLIMIISETKNMTKCPLLARTAAYLLLQDYTPSLQMAQNYRQLDQPRTKHDALSSLFKI